MNTIANTTAPQPFQRALASAHVLPTTWHTAFAAQGAVRLRDERAAGAVVTAAAAEAAAFAHTKGPVAWSPPPC